MAPFSAQDVLTQLDESAVVMTFPMLDNGYHYPVDVRLHVLRDDTRWALVIEDVGYTPRGGNLYDVLHAYGNCLDGEPGTDNDDFLARIDNWDEIEDRNAPEVWAIDADAVVIRGTRVPVSPKAGSDLVEVFRSLVPEHRNLLLATESELRRRIPDDLPKLLQLEEWHHPDIVVGVLPSGTSTFRQLADVIETGEIQRYRAETPNTHWSNWPEGGLL